METDHVAPSSDEYKYVVHPKDTTSLRNQPPTTTGEVNIEKQEKEEMTTATETSLGYI
jgi:hypothetical protein